MNVADAMTPRSEVVTVDLPGSRDDVLRYLQERAFSSVPVVKETDGEERYRGLVSRQDLIENPDEDQLALLMADVPTVSSEASIEDVAHVVISEGARRLPVVDGGHLEGIVTVTDVVRALATGDVEDGDHTVGDLARLDVNTTHEETPLLVAERELFYARVPYAVVLDGEGEMSGILTEVDVIDVARVVEGEEDAGESFADQDDEWMWEGIKAVGNRYMPTRNVELPAGPVSEFMTADPVTVNARRTVQEVAQVLLEHDVEQVPLVRADGLAGIVRDVDLLKAL
jgi:CBS domain-containing protein